MNPFRWSFRAQFLAGFLGCAALIAYAIYTQLYQGLEPCPLCIFQRIAYALPFVHAVELDRAALSGDWASVMPHLWWVLAYAAAALAAAVLLFLRQMKRQ